MNNKIIRLIPKKRSERIKLTEEEINNDEFINIFRKDYSEEIKGIVFRSKNGTAIIVNENCTPSVQANIIKEIMKGISKCPSSEFGIVDKDIKFRCGGHCCFGSA